MEKIIPLVLFCFFIVSATADCPLSPYPRRTILGKFNITQAMLTLNLIMILRHMKNPLFIHTPLANNYYKMESMLPLEWLGLNLMHIIRLIS